MPVRPLDLLTVRPVLCVFPYVQGAGAVMKEEAAENKSRLQKARGGSCVMLGIHCDFGLPQTND